MYSKIYQAGRLLLWRGGFDTRRYVQALRKTQWLSPDGLQALQLAKLQKLVTHAYQNVPFYRKTYQAAGFEPGDLKTLDDFALLPFINRDQINQHREELIDQTFDRKKLIANETGGSTGEPMHFFIDDSFWWWNAANNFRLEEWHGKHEGDKVAWLWGAKEDMPEWSWRRRVRSALMRERYLNAFNMTEEKMAEFAQMLLKWQPMMFYGYATTLTLFAEFVQRKGITGISPHIIQSTSEKLTRPQQELISKVFNCPVIDQYSSREMGTMAYENKAGQMLTCADVRYIEVIANGQLAPAGEMGAVAVTSLYQFSFPFIRYKNGDMAIFDSAPAKCGRPFPVLKEMVGRTNDYLVSADGRFVHSEFFAYTFRVKPEVDSYQIYQPDPHHLEVRLALRHPVSNEWLESSRQEVQKRFGESMSIKLEVVDHIQKTRLGKHRFIISDVKPEF